MYQCNTCQDVWTHREWTNNRRCPKTGNFVCPCSERAYTYTRLRPSPLKKLGQKTRPRLSALELSEKMVKPKRPRPLPRPSRPRNIDGQTNYGKEIFEEVEPIDIMEDMAKCIEKEMDVEAEGIHDNVLKTEPKVKPKPKKAAGARDNRIYDHSLADPGISIVHMHTYTLVQTDIQHCIVIHSETHTHWAQRIFDAPQTFLQHTLRRYSLGLFLCLTCTFTYSRALTHAHWTRTRRHTL